MQYHSVTDAQRTVLEKITQLGTETIPLEQTRSRVLAEDVRANRNQPPYDVSAMDGFALRSADVSEATHTPAALQIVEEIKAGNMPRHMLAAGQCARIMTGAPVPQGADAVIPVEDTQSLPNNNV